MKDKLKFAIGLLLCLIGIVFILYFTFLKVLIIVPILLFFGTLFIKSRIISFSLNALTIIPFLVVLFIIRFPMSESIVVESRIRYQMIDLGQGDFIRNGIELKLGNKRVFLQDAPNRIYWLYVNSSDFKKVWPESPFKMQEKNYTIKAKLKAYKLINGGYSRATVMEIDTLHERPIFSK